MCTTCCRACSLGSMIGLSDAELRINNSLCRSIANRNRQTCVRAEWSLAVPALCNASHTRLFHGQANQAVTTTTSSPIGEGVARSTARSDCCVPEKAFATAGASVGRSA